MKLVFSLIFNLTVFIGFSQSSAYKESMKKQVVQFNAATGKTEFLKVAKGFETLAASEKKEWLPFYYAGLCHAIAAFEVTKAEVDALCDKGDKLAKTADSLSPANSETDVLKAMLAAARITVNEKQRGQKYGSMSSRFATSAIKLNDANPRAYLLKGRALLYTPEVFGGGAKKAKPFFEKSLEKFKMFKPETPLYPDWGKEDAEKELKKINDKPIKKN